jgi:hypothetical protein
VLKVISQLIPGGYIYTMIPKPNIKRREQLFPLCGEHLDGLLFCTRLKQGLGNGTDLHLLAKYTRWFWKHHIRPHFFQEEKILMPYLPSDHPLASKLKDEHAEILELMIEIDRNVLRHDLEHLARFINSHINWEETELYTYLESNLSEIDLNEIHAALTRNAANPTVNWNELFWLK